MKKWRAVIWVSWGFSLAILAWILWQPILFTALKIAVVLLGIWVLLAPALRWKRLFYGVGAVGIFGAAIALWPPQAPPPETVRENYVSALRGALGTRYVWGGENSRGLDCSGLLRFAMIRALVQTGWQTRNPSLWREAGAIWWRDCSANEMRRGYGGQIALLFEADSLNSLPDSRLQIGDLAVTGSGSHVLAFVGNRGWIQADPNLANGGDKVVLTTAPSKNGWLRQKAQICRWKFLEKSGSFGRKNKRSQTPPRHLAPQ